MATTLWLRNPDLYLNAAKQSGINRWVLKEVDDPQGFMNVHLPSQKYFCLHVEGSVATLFDRGHSPEDPLAVMPVGPPAEVFESVRMRMITYKEEEELLDVGRGRLGMHLADCGQFSTAFGRGFPSADMDFSKVPDAFFYHPGGGLLRWTEAEKYGRWIALLGYHWEELSIPEVRLAFNISAARWAAEYFTEDEAVLEQATMSHRGVWATKVRSTDPLPGDKYYCGLCAYSQTCPKYREGSICTVAKEPGELAAKFGSRDPWKIIEAMTDVTQDEVARYEAGREGEDKSGKLDPALTALGGSIFRHGKQLLQLHHPQFRNPVLQITAMGNVGVGTGQQQTPQTLASQAEQALLNAGCDLEDITFEHISDLVDEGITDQAVSRMARSIQERIIEAGEAQ